MLAHPQDFVPFLPSVEGEDGIGAGDSGIIGPREYARYCANIRDTERMGWRARDPRTQPRVRDTNTRRSEWSAPGCRARSLAVHQQPTTSRSSERCG
jgi:hypothetical protein